MSDSGVSDSGVSDSGVSHSGVSHSGVSHSGVSESTLVGLLPRIGQAIGRCHRHAVATHGLTPTSLGVLAALADGGPASHRELAARLGVVPGTLTPVVDALERAGSVTRQRDSADRRVVRVAVSAAGRARLAAANAQAAQAFAERLPRPPPGQEAMVRAYLLAVLDAFDDVASPRSG